MRNLNINKMSVLSFWPLLFVFLLACSPNGFQHWSHVFVCWLHIERRVSLIAEVEEGEPRTEPSSAHVACSTGTAQRQMYSICFGVGVRRDDYYTTAKKHWRGKSMGDSSWKLEKAHHIIHHQHKLLCAEKRAPARALLTHWENEQPKYIA